MNTITAGAETPYEVFGHKGKTLETKLEKGGGIIELINTDTTSDVGRLCHPTPKKKPGRA